MSLDVDGSKYFLIHHTPADTIDKIDPVEMAKCAATVAVMAYVVADLPQRLPGRVDGAGYNFLMKKLTLCGLRSCVADRVLAPRRQQARRPAPADVVATVGSHVDHARGGRRQGARSSRPRNFGAQAVAGALRARRARARRDRSRRQLMDAGGEGAGHRPRRARREGDHLEGDGGHRRRDRRLVSGQSGARAGRAARAGAAADPRVSDPGADAGRSAQDTSTTLKSKTTGARHARPAAAESDDGAGEPGDGARRTRRSRSIEFSDFQCPFCFSGSVRRSSRCSTPTAIASSSSIAQYPLPEPPERAAGVGGGTVRERAGKVLAVPRSPVRRASSSSAPATSNSTPSELGLDAARFNACVDSHKYARCVEADISAGNDAGVNGTPAFFINGRMISGAQPFEEFKKIIDDELAREEEVRRSYACFQKYRRRAWCSGRA